MKIGDGNTSQLLAHQKCSRRAGGRRNEKKMMGRERALLVKYKMNFNHTAEPEWIRRAKKYKILKGEGGRGERGR